jgi:hypothetical protein
MLPPWALPRASNRGKLPASGMELLTRLNKYDQDLVKAGRCKAGELPRCVLAAGQKAGHPADLEQWSGRSGSSRRRS